MNGDPDKYIIKWYLQTIPHYKGNENKSTTQIWWESSAFFININKIYNLNMYIYLFISIGMATIVSVMLTKMLGWNQSLRDSLAPYFSALISIVLWPIILLIALFKIVVFKKLSPEVNIDFQYIKEKWMSRGHIPDSHIPSEKRVGINQATNKQLEILDSYNIKHDNRISDKEALNLINEYEFNNVYNNSPSENKDDKKIE